MPAGERMESAFRIGGAVGILLGAWLVYDSFYQK